MSDIESDRHQLLDILNRIECTLNQIEPFAGSVLAQLRWELARRIFPYLTVDAMINPRRQETSGLLLDRVRTHLQTWDSGRIRRDWQDYRSETRALVISLQNHLNVEPVVHPAMTQVSG